MRRLFMYASNGFHRKVRGLIFGAEYMNPSTSSIAQLLRQQFVWRMIYYATVFGVNVLISRKMGASASGQLFYLTTQLALWVLVLSFSLDAAVGYFLASRKAGLRQLSLIAIGGTSLASVLFAAWLGVNGRWSSDQWQLLYLLGIMLSNFFAQLGWALQQPVRINLALTLPNFLLLGYILAGQSLNWPLGSNWGLLYFASTLLQGLMVMMAVILNPSAACNTSFPVKAFLRYGLAAFTGNLLFFLLYRVDLWVLKWLEAAPAAALGNYIQAGKFGQLLVIVPQIMSTVFFPKVAAGESMEQTITPFLFICRWMTLLFGLLALVCALAGQWLFTTLLGPEFDRVNGLFLLLIPGILFICQLTLVSSILSGLGRLRVNVLGAAWALALALTLYVVLMPWLGVYGAAIGSSIAYSLNLFYSLHHLRKIKGFSWADMFVLRSADFSILVQKLRP